MTALAAACGGIGDEGSDSTSSASTASRWTLPSSVAAVGAQTKLAYDAAPAWTGPSACSGMLRDGTRELGHYLRLKFPALQSVGGYACRRNTAARSRMSVHGTGRALDLFVPTRGGRADSAGGDPIANWLVMHSAEIGVQLVIWNRTVWRANGTNTSNYTGPVPHIDHLHVELTEEGAMSLVLPDEDGTDAGVDAGMSEDAGASETDASTDAGAPRDAGATDADAGAPPPPPPEPEPEPDPEPEDVDAASPEPPRAPVPEEGGGWEVPEVEHGEEDSLGEPTPSRRSPRATGDDSLDLEPQPGCSAAPGSAPHGVAGAGIAVAAILAARARRRRAG